MDIDIVIILFALHFYCFQTCRGILYIFQIKGLSKARLNGFAADKEEEKRNVVFYYSSKY